MTHFTVLTPGLLSTIQDVRGRPGLGRYGIAAGGALDGVAATLANTLLGNASDAPVLEMTRLGPTLRLEGGNAVVAIVGADMAPLLNERPLDPGWSVLLRPGDVLQFGVARAGARAYLAVAGGFDVPRVLGSASTDQRAGFGGFRGRALRTGDRLGIVPAPGLAGRAGRPLTIPPALKSAGDPGPIRVLPGPHVGLFEAGALERFCAAEWQVGDGADRMGLRLQGPQLRHRERAEADVVSLGLPDGAIQVPGDGQPIVLLADHQPTGGYPVLACAIGADLPRLAQRATSDVLRFALCTRAEALAALQAQAQALLRPASGQTARMEA